MKHGDEVLAIPLGSFTGFQASLIAGTPMARMEIWALDGARIFPDGAVKLVPQEGFPAGLLLSNLRFLKASPTYHWSEFDSCIVGMALEGLPYEVFRELAPGVPSSAARDLGPGRCSNDRRPNRFPKMAGPSSSKSSYCPYSKTIWNETGSRGGLWSTFATIGQLADTIAEGFRISVAIFGFVALLKTQQAAFPTDGSGALPR
jgi:hypothetical protein